MKFTFLILTATIFLLSCGDTSTKSKELELKEKELALKERELNMKDSERISKINMPDNIKPKEVAIIPTKKYVLVKKTNQIPGDINSPDISKLTEPLLAVAAFYSGLGGTNCTGEECDLTTALGLGKQGSIEHKRIISKWLPRDQAAKQLIEQDCYQRPSGASSFSDYEYLTIEQTGDTIVVKYNLMHWSRGDIVNIKGPDKYLISGNSLTTLKRNIWKEF
jgi:hypothetical protein